jgi:hypothetical protein
MWRHVIWNKSTDVTEDHTASIFRIEEWFKQAIIFSASSLLLRLILRHRKQETNESKSEDIGNIFLRSVDELLPDHTAWGTPIRLENQSLRIISLYVRNHLKENKFLRFLFIAWNFEQTKSALCASCVTMTPSRNLLSYLCRDYRNAGLKSPQSLVSGVSGVM